MILVKPAMMYLSSKPSMYNKSVDMQLLYKGDHLLKIFFVSQFNLTVV